MKALLYTSDPYAPRGVIGLFETEKQKQNIIKGYIQAQKSDYRQSYMNHISQEKVMEHITYNIKTFTEINIPIGIYGEYY